MICFACIARLLAAFYLGGAVAATLFMIHYIRVFGRLGMLGWSPAVLILRTAVLWPMYAYRFAFPKVPKAVYEQDAYKDEIFKEATV